MILFSCSKDDIVTTGNENLESKEIKVMNFTSMEELDNKEQYVYNLKAELEKKNILIYKKQSNSLNAYHEEKIRNIQELRKNLNFVSIQSIADEINSLTLVDKQKADQLFLKHKKFLIKKPTGIETIFYQNTDLINTEGEILIKGEKLTLERKSSSITGRYIRDEVVKTGLVGSSQEFYVYYFAGRELHKNDLGVRFFRYFTELKAFILTPNGLVSCPATFDVKSGSIAGFVQSGSSIFSEYAFSYPYISAGRYVGGKINTAYVPAGGRIIGTFTTIIGARNITFSKDIKYVE